MTTQLHTPFEFSRKESARYDSEIAQGFRNLSMDKPPGGIVGEASDELAKRAGGASELGMIRMPLCKIFGRAMSANAYASGGAFVADDKLLAPDAVPRPTHPLEELGAKVIVGLKSPAVIPRETTAAVAQSLHELDTGTDQDGAWGALNFEPHRIFLSSVFSEQLLIQAGEIFGAFIIDSIRLSNLSALMKTAIQGTGVAGEINGVLNTAGIGSKVFAGSATQNILADMKSTALGNNADRSTLAWLTHPDAEKKWSTLYQNGTGSAPLWNTDKNTVLGVKAVTTTDCPSASVVIGDWSRFYIGIFGESAAIRIDPFSLSLGSKVRYTSTLYADAATTRPALFVKSSDAIS